MDTAREYLQKSIDGAQRELTINYVLGGLMGYDTWKESALGRLAKALGPEPQSCPLNWREEAQGELEGFVIKKVLFDSEPGLVTPALLLARSDVSAQSPGLVLLHGHGETMYDALNVDKELKPISHNYYRLSALAMNLVQSGVAVLVPELYGFGDLRLEEDRLRGVDSCRTLAPMLSLLGKNMLGVRVHQVRRALTGLSRVCDASRMGVAGFSGGGTVAMLACALDTRIKLAALMGCVGSFKTSLLEQAHCCCNYIPGLLESLDIPDILALSAAKKLFVASGLHDMAYPIDAAREAAQAIQRLMEKTGGMLETNFFDGGHRANPGPAAEFIQKNL